MWYSYTEDRRDDRLVNRTITGDTDWTTQHVVLDIPANAVVISYGVGLDGPGKLWIDNALLEPAAPDTPITSPVRPAEMLQQTATFVPDHLLPAPKNLDFEPGGFEGECNRQVVLYLGDILDQYKRLGWKLIDAERAYTDPIFNEKPDVLPAGDSLVLAVALQAGKTKLPRSPPEDGVYEAPNMDRLGL